MTPFDIIGEIVKGEDWKEEFRNIYSPFLSNKYFSNTKKYLYLSQIADIIVNPEMNYNFWKGMVLKDKKRIAWIKNSKDDIEIEAIMKYYQVNKRNAKEYFKLLSKEDKLLILNTITEKEK